MTREQEETYTELVRAFVIALAVAKDAGIGGYVALLWEVAGIRAGSLMERLTENGMPDVKVSLAPIYADAQAKLLGEMRIQIPKGEN